MLAFNKFFVTSLQIIVLLLSLHWFLVSLIVYPILFPVGLLIGALFVFRRGWLKYLYHFLTHHKQSLLVLGIIFQVLVILSSHLMIRSDAAVVFQGAIGELAEKSIASYLTRNPNNMTLFLYERFFYRLFSENALWLLQGINLICVNTTAYIMYKIGNDFFSQTVADISYLFYLLLLVFSPYYMAMYTDILGLPLLALELYLALKLLTNKQENLKTIILLGVVTALAMLWRSTALISIVALVIGLGLKGAYKQLMMLVLVFSLSFGLVFGTLTTLVKHQNEVVVIEGDGLAKTALHFINLGLTFSGTDQEDMKEGLRQYLPKEKRHYYNNGMFKKQYVIMEIKRRWSEYTWRTFAEHLLYKQAETVNDGTLGWLYQKPSKEKTAYISPLYETLKNKRWSKWFRDYIIEKDSENYYYFALLKQGVWLLLSLGLCFACLGHSLSDKRVFIMLAMFGGLLFLLIFEGGKGRYLIQFIPQIILLSALGWENVKRKGIL